MLSAFEVRPVEDFSIVKEKLPSSEQKTGSKVAVLVIEDHIDENAFDDAKIAVCKHEANYAIVGNEEKCHDDQPRLKCQKKQSSSCVEHEESNDPSSAVERKVVENAVRDLNDLEKKEPPAVDKEEDYVCEKAIKHDVESFEKKVVEPNAEKLIIDIKEIEKPPDSTAQTEFQMNIVNDSVVDYIQVRDAVAVASSTINTEMMEVKDDMHEVDMVIYAIKVNTDEDSAETDKKSRPYAFGGYKIPHNEGVQCLPSAKIARAKSIVANYSHDEVPVVVNGHNYHQEYGGLLDRSWFDLQLTRLRCTTWSVRRCPA